MPLNYCILVNWYVCNAISNPSSQRNNVFQYVFFGCSDGMEREACVCDHGYERSDLCAEIIIIIILYFIFISPVCVKLKPLPIFKTYQAVCMYGHHI